MLRFYAHNTIPKYTWEDIVLPANKKTQLKKVCNYVKQHQRGNKAHDFEKQSLGKGVKIMFSGPSGTGKTMAAQIIASELELDMYKIDLSMVGSKYIGETEKKLNRIFEETEVSNAILFFDEADALFGKRSEVKDSHDRYANAEIDYLLQKMENHNGIVILTSNLGKKVDDAFVRRMHFIVDFPMPKLESRIEIWRKVLQKNHSLEDVDFDLLSKWKISGGDIKKIALKAASCQVTKNSDKITMADIVTAANKEPKKDKHTA